MREEDVARHFARERRAGFLHLGLDQAVAGLPHHGLPPSSATRSYSAWLALTSAMIVAPGRTRSTGSAQDREQLVAPDDAALPVDRADAIAVAVEGESEIEVLLRDQLLQVREVLFLGRIGMMVGEGAVDLGEERVMLTRQQLDELLDHGTRRAIAVSQPMRNAPPA
jgi:hypothetical protein